MKPTGDNSSRNPETPRNTGVPGHSSASPSRARDGAPKPAAMYATLSPRAYGWQLDLCPMRAFDALRIWPKLSPAHDSASLLFDVSPDPAGRLHADLPEAGLPRLHERAAPLEAPDRFTLGSLADRLSIPSIERFDDDQLVMDAMPLRELVGMIEHAKLRAVCVDGPIEPRDAGAMLRAIAAGLSPLQAEFRASAAIEVIADHKVTLQSREKKPALRLVAESFRLFVSAICFRGRPIDEVAAPEPWQVERLIDVSGTISMRPIETDLFSTFIDVGVSTEAEPFTKPANHSLIYDLPSNTWHDEP